MATSSSEPSEGDDREQRARRASPDVEADAQRKTGRDRPLTSGTDSPPSKHPEPDPVDASAGTGPGASPFANVAEVPDVAQRSASKSAPISAASKSAPISAPMPSPQPPPTPVPPDLPPVLDNRGPDDVVLEQIGEAAVGFALAGLMNLLRRARGKAEPVSPMMLQLLAQRYDDQPDDPSAGFHATTLEAGLRGLRLHGVCSDARWRRLGLTDISAIPPDVAAEAARNRPAEYESVPIDRTAMRIAIAREGALVVAAAITAAWQRPQLVRNASGSSLTVIADRLDDEPLGGHAFAVVGYNEIGFLVQNSWGRSWGKHGYATWPYETAEATAFQAWAVRLLPTRPHLAGYASDGLLGEDRLGITPDVRAIASLITAREVKPPLALGLFGDWGSGKSFFMERLEEEVVRRAEASQKAGIASPFCSSVIQIKFNAWHYLDTNLWASLVAEVFEQLFRAVSGDPTEAQVRETIERELGNAKGLFRESQLELVAAKNRLGAANDQLAEARLAAESILPSSDMILEEALTTVTSDPAIRTKVGDLAKNLGVPADENLYEQLQEPVDEARSIQTRIGRILSWTARTIGTGPGRTRRILGVLGFVIVPTVALVAAISLLDLAAPLIPLLGAALGLLAGLRPYLKQAGAILGQFERASADIDAATKEKQEEITKAQLEAYNTALAAQAAAETRAIAAERKVQELESSLAEFAPARQVQRFLKEKSTSQAYASQLGLVSLIRRDFERLSDLLKQREVRLDLARQAELDRLALETAGSHGSVLDDLPGDTAARAGAAMLDSAAAAGGVDVAQRDDVAQDDSVGPATSSGGEVPIDRIVLYIDDLDRCKPRRVVEVLEAVHLLLAFRLFVVIVAVDPRWLRRCLEDQYPELLSMAGSDDAGSVAQGLTRTSTPQDYLEKIFQIPFYLRPLRDQGFVDLVADLVGKDVLSEETGRGTNGTSPPGAGAADGGRASILGGAVGQAREGGTGGGETSLSTGRGRGSGDSGSEGAPDRLVFNPWEVEDMQRLSPLFRTPRSAKRFVNTYRLIRATIDSADRQDFEGTREAPGTYRHVLLLLSVVAGYPNVAPRLLVRLAESKRGRVLTWATFVEQCRSASSAAGDSGEWQDLCDGLDRVSKTDLAPQRLALLYPWIAKVARYSFSVSLPGTLDDLLETAPPTPRRNGARRRTSA